MELEEAKEIMKDWVKYEKQNKDKINKADELIEVQETLLNYIEKAEKQIDLDYVDKNYIHKDKIEALIDRIEKEYEDSKDENGNSEYYFPNYTIDKLQELLRE